MRQLGLAGDAEERKSEWQRASFQEKLLPIFHVLEGAAVKDAHKGLTSC